jgi:hypothetical protein
VDKEALEFSLGENGMQGFAETGQLVYAGD